VTGMGRLLVFTVDRGAAEIQRIAENASRWPDMNLAASHSSKCTAGLDGGDGLGGSR
jgi:hypothetical protein